MPSPVSVVGKGIQSVPAPDSWEFSLGLAVAVRFRIGHRGRAGHGRAGLSLPAVGLTHRPSGWEWAVPSGLNAGGHGSDTAATLVAYRWVDPRREWRTNRRPKARFGYLASTGRGRVLRAPEPGDPAEGGHRRRWRRANPAGGSNAGSVFTNPPGTRPAGTTARAASTGWERRKPHANFIQACRRRARAHRPRDRWLPRPGVPSGAEAAGRLPRSRRGFPPAHPSSPRDGWMTPPDLPPSDEATRLSISAPAVGTTGHRPPDPVNVRS